MRLERLRPALPAVLRARLPRRSRIARAFERVPFSFPAPAGRLEPRHAAISFVNSALGGTTTTTSFSVTLPATAAGDLILLEFTHRGTGDGTIGGTYSGGAFALKHSQLYATSTFSGKLYWSRATGDHAGQTVTGASLTNSCAAIVTIYRGVLASGDPFNGAATIVGEQNASGNETQAQIDVLVAAAWVCLTVCNSPDVAISSQACTTPGALTERAERLSTGGTDTSIAHASAEKAAAGVTGAFTWAQTDGASGSYAYALQPAAAVILADAAIDDGADAVSSESDLPIAGAVSLEDATDTIGAGAVLPIAGAAAIADEADALAATLELEGGERLAQFNVTDADDLLAAAAAAPIAAAAALADAADAIAAAGALPIAGSAALVDAADLLAAAAGLSIGAAAALADGVDTVAAVLELTGGPERLAAFDFTDTADAIAATLELEGGEAPSVPSSGPAAGGQYSRSRRRATRVRGGYIPDLRTIPPAPVVPPPVRASRFANVAILDDDDRLEAGAGVRDSAKIIGRRRAVQFLLMT